MWDVVWEGRVDIWQSECGGMRMCVWEDGTAKWRLLFREFILNVKKKKNCRIMYVYYFP